METGSNTPKKEGGKNIENQSNTELVAMVKQMQEEMAAMKASQTMTPDAIASDRKSVV